MVAQEVVETIILSGLMTRDKVKQVSIKTQCALANDL